MSTFGSILDKPSNSIERAPPMPTGTYICVVQGMPRLDASAQKKTKFIEFTLIPRQVLEDVDRDALGEAGGLDGKKFLHQFYYERANGEEIPNADYNIRSFCDHCGLDTDTGTKLMALCEGTVNQQVAVKMKHEPSQDGTYMVHRIASTSPVE